MPCCAMQVVHLYPSLATRDANFFPVSIFKAWYAWLTFALQVPLIACLQDRTTHRLLTLLIPIVLLSASLD
jgi:hypothetical protein